MTPTQEAALREAATCKACANVVDWPTQLSKKGLCIECLEKRCERLVEASKAILPLICGEDQGGELVGMSDLDKRLEWYEKLRPLRIQLRAAIEEAEETK